MKDLRTLQDKLTFVIDHIQLPTYEELRAFDAYLKKTVGLPIAKRLNVTEFVTLFRFTNVQDENDILCKDCTKKTKS